MEWMNEYSGLFSLLAVVAAVIVPCIIYCKQKKDQQMDWEDELDSYENNSMFPMNNNDREFYARQNFLKKKSKRRRK